MRHNVGTLCIVALLAFGSDVQALPWTKGKPAARPARRASTHFTTFEACMRDVARSMPRGAASLVLQAGLEGVCRAREALATGSNAPCRALTDYRAQERCKRYYGVQKGRLRDCPQFGFPRIYDGLCAALVRRDPSFCRLAEDVEQSTCVGALLGSGACKQKKAHDKARCLAAAAAWKGKLKAGKRLLPVGYEPRLEIRTTALSSTTLPSKVVNIHSKRLSRGVVLADRAGKGDHFAIVYSLARRARHRNPREPMQLRLWVPLPQVGAPKDVALGVSTGGGQVSFSLSAPYRWVKLPITSGKVSFQRFERKVGGRIAATFSMVASNGVERVRLEGRLDTFVRQLLPLTKVARVMRSHTRAPKRYGRFRRGRLGAQEISQVKKSIRKLSETRYEIDKALRDELVKDTSLMVKAASIYPRRTEPKGYKLSRVYRNGVLWQLGLRDGDVVLSINRKKLERAESAFVAYARLRRASKLVVEISRGGRELSVVYRVKRVRKKKDGKLVLVPKDRPPSVPILGTLGAGASKGILYGRGGYGGLGLRGTGRGGGGKGYGKIGLGGKPTPKKRKKKQVP